jgi:hypothetical protein
MAGETCNIHQGKCRSSMIREATPKDMDALISMGEKFSKFIQCNFSTKTIRNIAETALTREDAQILIAVDITEPVGMIGVMIVGGDAAEVFCWVDVKGRNFGIDLVKGFELWAKNRAAKNMYITHINDTGLDDYLKRQGYEYKDDRFIKKC